MRTALVIGNGFTRSLTDRLRMAWCPSSPFSWPAKATKGEGNLLDEFPHLSNFLSTRTTGETDFEMFYRMLGTSDNVNDLPLPRKDTEDEIFDSGHYLALAFSQFQLQLDQQDLAVWHWLEWLSQNKSNLIAVLSWNYDLLFELSWARLGSPYFYPNVPGVCEGGNINQALTAIPVCKPHGSCNFAPAFRLNTLADNQPETVSYPRKIKITAVDGPVRALRRDELLEPRMVADIVLPGELNRFGKHLNWVDSSLSVFRSKLQEVDHLIVAGFSMGDADKREFLEVLGSRENFNRISIVNPAPSDELVRLLGDRCKARVDIHRFEMPC